MNSQNSGRSAHTSSIRYLLLLPFLFGCSHLHAMIIPGDLIITEMMSNPDAVSDSNGEWFEIYNTTESNIDLNGFTLRDQGADDHLVSSTDSLIIDSNSYFVFGRNENSLTNGGLTVDYYYSSFSLGNSGDEIILEYDGVNIATLLYDDNSPFSVAGTSAEWNGTTFELASASYGDGDLGTPGSGPLLASVPEPASLWLLSCGLVALVASRLRANQH